MDALQELDALEQTAIAQIDAATSSDDVEAARISYLGQKSGKIKDVQKLLGKLPPDQKPLFGKRFNEVKTRIEALLEAKQSTLSKPKVAANAIDVTLPGTRVRLGNKHPITQTMDSFRDIAGRLGFTVVDGPEIEDDYHNFVALNIPDVHPARDPLDNFYLSTAQTISKEARLLRSQTSTVQIRVMETTPPPIRIVSLGRVYRPDEIDATHYCMFHQMEGLLIDTHVNMAHLKTTLRLFATSYLGDDVQIRFRPSFFPFTEPSVEVDTSWRGGWMEVGGAGMVDPNVLKAVGYDPEKVSGFAFGFGVERFCMRRFGITDIRRLYENNVRFLSQFPS
jgi:phenylalanyl-tRNA synthetase alpha chain